MQVDFFKHLFNIMEDKETVKITVEKIGDSMTLMVTRKNKVPVLFKDGTLDELDDAFIDHLKHPPQPEVKEFPVTTLPVPEKDDDDEEEDSPNITPAEKKVNKSAKKDLKEKKASKSKQPSWQGRFETLINEKKFEEAYLLIDAAKADSEKPEDKNETPDEPTSEKNEEKSPEPPIEETKPEEAAAPESPKVEDEKDFKFYMEAGESAFKERKYQAAKECYAEAMKLAPDGNTSAKKGYEKACAWVKAMSEL